MKRYRDEDIRKIRNEIAIRTVIENLLNLPHENVEGIYRFNSGKLEKSTTSH